MDINPAQAQAYIVNPLTGRKFEFAGLWSSHPPTAERIQRLRSERF
jgi:Zn-dependent protease with chaperone function